MLNEKDYCDYELRLGLRDIGYPMSTCQINNGPIQMPKITLYEAQKWLREEMCIHIEVLYQPLCWTGKIYDLAKRDYIKGFTFFESFEDALCTLIKEAVKILKEN